MRADWENELIHRERVPGRACCFYWTLPKSNCFSSDGFYFISFSLCACPSFLDALCFGAMVFSFSTYNIFVRQVSLLLALSTVCSNHSTPPLPKKKLRKFGARKSKYGMSWMAWENESDSFSVYVFFVHLTVSFLTSKFLSFIWWDVISYSKWK